MLGLVLHYDDIDDRSGILMTSQDRSKLEGCAEQRKSHHWLLMPQDPRRIQSTFWHWVYSIYQLTYYLDSVGT
jgi:hypothetical protein